MRKTGKENIVSFYKQCFAQLPGVALSPMTARCRASSYQKMRDGGEFLDWSAGPTRDHRGPLILSDPRKKPTD
jgi:hypothetical protein